MQQRYTERLALRLGTPDRWFLDACQRVDDMSYEERRATLRQFVVQVRLWRSDHEPRWEMDWAFDLGAVEDWFDAEPWEPQSDLGLAEGIVAEPIPTGR